MGPAGTWQPTFADEFDGPGLDPARWTTCYWWDRNGCTNLGNKELQWYQPGNVTVENGRLVLTARQEVVVGHEGRLFEYTSGMVTSGRLYEEEPSAVRFSQTFGAFEVRARVPTGRGLWPAFWMLPTTLESKPEIDVMEVLGHEPGRLELHYHYADEAGERQSFGHDVKVGDLSRDWHVYGVEWSAEAIIWYLDGREVWRFEETGAISREPMYLILNLAVGGEWPGDPDASTVFPSRFEIDWVRAWRREGGAP